MFSRGYKNCNKLLENEFSILLDLNLNRPVKHSTVGMDFETNAIFWKLLLV